MNRKREQTPQRADRKRILSETPDREQKSPAGEQEEQQGGRDTEVDERLDVSVLRVGTPNLAPNRADVRERLFERAFAHPGVRIVSEQIEGGEPGLDLSGRAVDLCAVGAHLGGERTRGNHSAASDEH